SVGCGLGRTIDEPGDGAWRRCRRALRRPDPRRFEKRRRPAVGASRAREREGMRSPVLEGQRHAGSHVHPGVRPDAEGMPIEVRGARSFEDVQSLSASRVAEARGEAGRDFQDPERQGAGARRPAEPGPDPQGAVNLGVTLSKVRDAASRVQRHVHGHSPFAVDYPIGTTCCTKSGFSCRGTRRMAIPKWQTLLALGAAAALSQPSMAALDPTVRLSQYAHTAWLVREGFLGSAPYSISQTTDGYLWIGSENGLVRFDGARFVPWDPPPGA